jgi:uncharacterized protein YeaC (DUF1315 family)
MFRAQADWAFIFLSELPTKELGHLPRKMPPQAYQTSQYAVLHGGIFLGKWRSTFAGSFDRKTNVQSACALNTRYNKPIKHSTAELKTTPILVTAHTLRKMMT